MFDNNKMAQFLMAGKKPVEDTPAPKVKGSGLITLSEAFKKIADKEKQEAEAQEANKEEAESNE